MANDQNLIPIGDLTEDEQRAFKKKGGIASGVARRKKKGMKELAKIMLGCGANDEAKKAIKKMFPDLNEDEITVEAAILAKQAEKATEGDIKSAEFLRDTSGQKPTEKNLTVDVELDSVAVAGKEVDERIQELLK